MELQLAELQQRMEDVRLQNEELNRQNEVREAAFQQQQQQINALQGLPQLGGGQQNNYIRDAKRSLSYGGKLLKMSGICGIT